MATEQEAEEKARGLIQQYLLHEGHDIHQSLTPSMIDRKKKVPRSLRESQKSPLTMMSKYNNDGPVGEMSSKSRRSKADREQRARQKLLIKSKDDKKKKKKKKKSSSKSSSASSSGPGSSVSSNSSATSTMSEFSYGMNSPLAFVLTELRKVAPNNTSPKTFPSLQMEDVFSPWTDEHRQAYDKDALRCIRGRDIETMRAWHESGRTLQAANSFGESLLHLACRRGFLDVVTFLFEECEHDLWIKDDAGRTPLHDACWTASPQPDLVDYILSKDVDMLLVSDKRGHTPLDYAKKDHYEFWVKHFGDKDMKTLLPTRPCFMTDKETSTIRQDPEKAVVENLGLMISQLELEHKKASDEAANSSDAEDDEGGSKPSRRKSRRRSSVRRRLSGKSRSSSVEGDASVKSSRSRSSLLGFASLKLKCDELAAKSSKATTEPMQVVG
eukprot:CAMPEP_0194047046 /NCGR_PEP_ID=MMETSP0009_2-20130614/23527_1 /TAXON_ID=210454 /ORGANISM="Grammatophora oceanica, Strain CCMP 410" /LENGTH=440 /DNA_ID=CAMNT_0038692559 /DNA_START=181 /DNA_END=1503 /DNA_ORIENTATION=+